MEVSVAISEAVRQCDADVISAYPITPQAHVVEHLAEIAAQGRLDCEIIPVESEHSALSACVGSSAVGARTFTATSSQGLALMVEIMYIASALRMPIVMAVATRALSAPIVLLPVEQVREFLPPFSPLYRLDPKNPVSMGPVGIPEIYTEAKKAHDEAILASRAVIDEVWADFGKRFGRRYQAVEHYRTEGAQTLLVGMGALTESMRGRLQHPPKKPGVRLFHRRGGRPRGPPEPVRGADRARRGDRGERLHPG